MRPWRPGAMMRVPNCSFIVGLILELMQATLINDNSSSSCTIGLAELD